MRSWRRYRSVPIVYRIGVAFVLGSVFGLVVGQPATALQPLGDLFVNLLSMLIVPIVVFTLLMGARRLSPSNLGKIGGQVVALYALTSAAAVGFGLLVANLIDPGANLELGDAEAQTAEAPDIVEVILGIVPENPIAAMAAGTSSDYLLRHRVRTRARARRTVDRLSGHPERRRIVLRLG